MWPVGGGKANILLYVFYIISYLIDVMLLPVAHWDFSFSSSSVSLTFTLLGYFSFMLFS